MQEAAGRVIRLLFCAFRSSLLIVVPIPVLDFAGVRMKRAVVSDEKDGVSPCCRIDEVLVVHRFVVRKALGKDKTEVFIHDCTADLARQGRSQGKAASMYSEDTTRASSESLWIAVLRTLAGPLADIESCKHAWQGMELAGYFTDPAARPQPVISPVFTFYTSNVLYPSNGMLYGAFRQRKCTAT